MGWRSASCVLLNTRGASWRGDIRAMTIFIYPHHKKAVYTGYFLHSYKHDFTSICVIPCFPCQLQYKPIDSRDSPKRMAGMLVIEFAFKLLLKSA